MTRKRKRSLIVAGLFFLAAVLRFWAIGSHPGYEWDEPVYDYIATNLAHFGTLQAKPDFGTPVEAYVYHPPFYFLMLAGWFKLVGAGITSARILAALMSLIFLAVAYLFVRWYKDAQTALVSLVLLATDGWLVYCNRISWMENTLLVIVIAAVWVYAKAVENGNRNRFLAAGLLIGLATIFKHVGAYLIAVALLHWLITRKHNRQHLELLAVVAGVICVYLLGMTIVFPHDYWHETSVQFLRTIGAHSARGTVGSVGDFIKPTIDEYYIFYSTIFLALLGVGLVIGRVVQAFRRRNLDGIRQHSLLFAWTLAALICFGAINLKFPQYSILVLVPLYLYMSVEAVEFVRSHSETVRTAAYAGLALLVVLNGFTYIQRIPSRDDNALLAVGQYASAYLPPHARVITEEAVGDVIPQSYCKLYQVRFCRPYVQYIIIYLSFTERPPKQPGLERLIGKSIQLAQFKGFKETITVYKVDKRLNSDAYPKYRAQNERIRQANQRRREERL